MTKVRVNIGLLLIALMAAGSAQAVPDCGQINPGFCGYVPECHTETIEWRGSCPGSDRQWRCVWTDCDYGDPIRYGPWVYCNCPGGGGGGGGCDCLLAGTLITLADGTTKAVEDIQVGDRVLGYVEATAATGPAEVTEVHPPFSANYYFVLNAKIRLTGTHPVLSRGEWVAVTNLRVGDTLTTADGADERIFSIEKIDSPADTYNLKVSGGTYVASGYIVHNKENCEDYIQYPLP